VSRKEERSERDNVGEADKKDGNSVDGQVKEADRGRVGSARVPRLEKSLNHEVRGRSYERAGSSENGGEGEGHEELLDGTVDGFGPALDDGYHDGDWRKGGMWGECEDRTNATKAGYCRETGARSGINARLEQKAASLTDRSIVHERRDHGDGKHEPGLSHRQSSGSSEKLGHVPVQPAGAGDASSDNEEGEDSDESLIGEASQSLRGVDYLPR